MKNLDFTTAVLRAIASPKMKKRDISAIYVLLLVWTTSADIKTVNSAIIERWSRSGLKDVKTLAWREVERRRAGDPRDPR